MRQLKRYIGALVVAAAFVAPTVVTTTVTAQGVQVRVFDSNHRDYHNWDDREDRAYRRYLNEQHHSYREYNRQNKRSQRSYWTWRHSHPD